MNSLIYGKLYDFNLATPIKTREEEKTSKCHQCDLTFLGKDNLTSHMYKMHSEYEPYHSMQPCANIQSSTLIQSEKHSFQYGIFDQNIANHSNSSTQFNSQEEFTFQHQFIPPNIQMRILPSNIHVKTQGDKNIPMSILNKSKKHQQKSVSFAAGSIEQMSSISKRDEFKLDSPFRVSSQCDMPCEISSLNTLPSIQEYQQLNAMEEFFRKTNIRSLPTNTDNVEYSHMTIPNTEMSILKKSTKHPHERVSFAAGSIEQLSSISKQTEENPFDFDNTLQVPSQYHTSTERLNITPHHSMHEHQQPNIIDESFLHTNIRSTPTNTYINLQMHNFACSSKQNRETFSTASEQLESYSSTEHSIMELSPRPEKP